MGDVGRGLAGVTEYRRLHGHVLVPRGFTTPDGFRLGEWLYRQRLRRRQGRLDAATQQTLDDLGVEWQRLLDSQRRALARCRQFAAEHGHLRVPKGYPQPDGIDVRGFVERCRRSWRRGTLAPAVAAALVEMDPGWAATGVARRIAADRFLDAASAWYEAMGHLRVPRRHITQNGVRLGGWLDARRRQRRVDTLPVHIGRSLDHLDPSWAAPPPGRPSSPTRRPASPVEEPLVRWRHQLDALSGYLAAQGHANVPRSFVAADGLRLGGWLAERRRDFRRGRLDIRMVAELRRLNVVFDPAAARQTSRPHAPRPRAIGHRDPRIPPSTSTEERPAPDRASANRTPRPPVPAAGPAGPTPDRGHRGLSQTAAAMVAAAHRWFTEHQHLRVPARHVTDDGLRLGAWLGPAT